MTAANGSPHVVGPGDVLIVAVPTWALTEEVRDHLLSELRRLTSDRCLLIECDDVQLAVVRGEAVPPLGKDGCFCVRSMDGVIAVPYGGCPVHGEFGGAT